MKTGLKKKQGPPFVRAFKIVVRDPKLSLQARAVLSIIRSYANTNGTHCYPSIDKIQADAGCPRRTLERYLSELRKACLIYTEQRKTKGGRRSSCLFLLFDEERARLLQKPSATHGARKMSEMAHGDASKIVDLQREIARRQFATENVYYSSPEK